MKFVVCIILVLLYITKLEAVDLPYESSGPFSEGSNVVTAHAVRIRDSPCNDEPEYGFSKRDKIYKIMSSSSYFSCGITWCKIEVLAGVEGYVACTFLYPEGAQLPRAITEDGATSSTLTSGEEVLKKYDYEVLKNGDASEKDIQETIDYKPDEPPKPDQSQDKETPKPVNCVWSEWEISDCICKQDASSYKIGSRFHLVEAAGGGHLCEGKDIVAIPCDDECAEAKPTSQELDEKFANVKCEAAGVGRGICRNTGVSNCKDGVFFKGLCSGPKQYQCCLKFTRMAPVDYIEAPPVKKNSGSEKKMSDPSNTKTSAKQKSTVSTSSPPPSTPAQSSKSKTTKVAKKKAKGAKKKSAGTKKSNGGSNSNSGGNLPQKVVKGIREGGIMNAYPWTPEKWLARKTPYCNPYGGYCGQCVSFVLQVTAKRGRTSQWRPGPKMMSKGAKRGDAVATFPNGKYSYSGHAAIFEKRISKNCVMMLSANYGSGPREHLVTRHKRCVEGTGDRNANSYYLIKFKG